MTTSLLATSSGVYSVAQLALLAENHASWQIAGILVVDGGSGRCHHGCCHHSSDSWQQPPTLCAVSSPCPSHRHVVMSARQRRLVVMSSPPPCLLVVMSPPPRRFATFVVATSPLHRRETILHRLSRLSYKIQQMILEQSFQESFQVFLLKAHRHNFGECVGGGNVVSICIIIMTLLSISLQTHPAKPASSWCKAPTLWCLLRKVQTSSAHSCPSDTHLLNLASLQVQGRFSSWSWYGGGISRIQPTRGFSDICGWRHFDHHSHNISSQLSTVYQSPVLYMHEHAAWPPSGRLSHSCLLMPSLLRASCWGSCHLPKISHHYSSRSPLNQRQTACHRCQGDWLTIFTAWISISFEVENSASTSATSTDAGSVAVSATLLNTTFSGILPGSSSSVLGSRYLDVSPEWH